MTQDNLLNLLPFAVLLPPHVQQHEDEEEEDHDRPGVDDHLQHGDEGRPEQPEDDAHRAQGDDEREGGVHRVALGDDDDRGGDRQRGEHVEEDGVHGQRPASATPVAVIRIHTAATGMSSFQPRFISWS